jgi:ribonucleoside-triphosphate reductase
MHNCLSIPFDDLFNKTIYTKQTAIRPPRSINTASQLLAVIIQVQSLQQYGGVAATHLDWTLIPFVRYTFFKHLRDGHKYITKDSFRMPKDIEATSIDKYKEDPCYDYAFDMTNKDTHQGMEALIHNLNSLQSRSGQQLPFSSINYGTCTLTEGRMVIEGILDATLEGTGPLHETPIFPCGIWQYDENINGKPGTPNYDLYKKALLCTTKRFYPNYCKANWTNNVNCVKMDREVKRKVIAKLKDKEKETLIEWIKQNPIDSFKISLTVDKGEIIVVDTPTPMEINSTMGKRKLQLI